MIIYKKRSRRLREFYKKVAAVGIAAAVVSVGALGVRALNRYTAKRVALKTEQLKRQIVDSRLEVDPAKWAPFFRIYKVDPYDFSAREFVLAVDRFCKESGLSLKRFFRTMEKHPTTEARIRQLEGSNDNYRKEIEGFELTANTKKGRERSRALSKIQKLNAQIQTNKRIQLVIGLCLGYKEQVRKFKNVSGSLDQVKALPD